MININSITAINRSYVFLRNNSKAKQVNRYIIPEKEKMHVKPKFLYQRRKLPPL